MFTLKRFQFECNFGRICAKCKTVNHTNVAFDLGLSDDLGVHQMYFACINCTIKGYTGVDVKTMYLEHVAEKQKFNEACAPYQKRFALSKSDAQIRWIANGVLYDDAYFKVFDRKMCFTCKHIGTSFNAKVMGTDFVHHYCSECMIKPFTHDVNNCSLTKVEKTVNDGPITEAAQMLAKLKAHTPVPAPDLALLALMPAIQSPSPPPVIPVHAPAAPARQIRNASVTQAILGRSRSTSSAVFAGFKRPTIAHEKAYRETCGESVYALSPNDAPKRKAPEPPSSGIRVKVSPRPVKKRK